MTIYAKNINININYHMDMEYNMSYVTELQFKRKRRDF